MKEFLSSLKYIFLFLFCAARIISAQDDIDVTFESKEDKIYIYYTLNADPFTEYEIKVILKRTSVPSFEYYPEELSGAVGEGKFAGIKRTIIWEVSEEEMEMFDGDDFYFKIEALKIEPGGGIPWYVFAGVAAAGGATAAILLLKGKDDETASGAFASPPARP